MVSWSASNSDGRSCPCKTLKVILLYTLRLARSLEFHFRNSSVLLPSNLVICFTITWKLFTAPDSMAMARFTQRWTSRDVTKICCTPLAGFAEDTPRVCKARPVFSGDHYSMSPLLHMMQTYVLPLVHTSKTSWGTCSTRTRALLTCTTSVPSDPAACAVLQLVQASRTSRGLARTEPAPS